MAFIIFWGYQNTKFYSEVIFLTEVQDNLVRLDGLIAYNIDTNWSEPNLVTQKLGVILTGLYLGLENGKYLKVISKSDQIVLERLSYKLSRYPQDEQYEFVELTQKDKEKFESLRTKLRAVGLGMNISYSKSMDVFIDQAKALEESIIFPLTR